MIGMSGMNADGNPNMEGVTTLGIMSALRTGNPQIDMLIALMLPFALNFLVTSFRKIYEWAVKRGFFAAYNSNDKYESRVITHKTMRDEYGDIINADTDDDTNNAALLKAIRLYLHNVMKIRLKDADLSLAYNEEKSSQHRDDYESSGRRNTLASRMAKYSVVPTPPTDKFVPIGSFGDSLVELLISENQETQGNEEEDNGNRSRNKTKETVVRYHLRSKDGRAIDDFLAKAYQYYLDVLRSNEDSSRYLLELKVPSSGSESSGHVYKRYRLSEEKTFESLFFKEKASLLALIKSFMERSGRFSIPGYPHKLGLLLHGPPGTGKTSLIKSLAQHTGRSIINVPLSRISTNSELMSIFYSSERRVEGQYCPATLGFKDVIYVMEDVDAASKIVKRRDGIKAGDPFAFENGAPIVQGKSVFQLFLESRHEKCEELVTKLVEKSERIKEELRQADTFRSVTSALSGLAGLGFVGETGNAQLKALAKETIEAAKKHTQEQEEVDTLLGNHAQTLLTLVENVDEIDDALVDELLARKALTIPSAPASRHTDDDDSSVDSVYPGVSRSPFSFGEEKKEDKGIAVGAKLPWKKSKGSPKNIAGLSSFFGPPPDALNLQGLLNVLDGVVDSPGRIIIMTTNRPEALDPALIRPGRVDKKLFLGYMAAVDVAQMLEHYYQTSLGPVQHQRIESVLAEKLTRPGLRMVPAQLEQMTAEFDDVDALIAALEAKANPAWCPLTSGG